ncbi:hypothetical protein ABW19_dt0208966 [Dactylella cylindrospora]|nr:hypothetical protein ABW19_dt0208966 [Dactylella cylindrospora]
MSDKKPPTPNPRYPGMDPGLKGPDYNPDFEYKSLYKRPGFGKLGKTAPILCNSFRVRRFPNSVIYQYDVQIMGKGETKRALLRKIFYSPQLQSFFGKDVEPHTVLYDGNRLAWSIKKLAFGEDLNEEIDMNENKERASVQNVFRVRMRKTTQVPLKVTEDYIKGLVPMDREVLVGMNFLDHLLRETPANRYITIKRSFFKHTGAQTLEGGVEAWKGIFQSIRPSQGGFLTINVDVASAVFWTETSLINCLRALLRASSPADLVGKLTSENGQRDLRRVKRLQFYTKHTKSTDSRKKKFTIEGFTKTGARTEFFDSKDYDTGRVERLTVETYYLKQYNIRLQFPTLPLIRTKKKNVLIPIELAFVCEGQRYPYKLNERQTADMIRFTVQRPNVRLEAIRSNVAELNWKEDPCLQKYGMAIDPNLINTTARILMPPTISYGPGSQEANFKPRGGRWDLRGKKFVRPAVLKSWGIGIAAQPRRVSKEAVQNFVRQFIQIFIQHGGKVENKDPPIMYMDPGKAISDSVREVFIASGNMVKHRPQVLFFVLTAKSAQPYNDIKAACDTLLGVTSQCLQSKHVEQAKAQYCSNVCMKVNAKLGGTTVYLGKDSHPFWGGEPTMYVGADVSHGGSFGGGGMKAASFASMVASTDVQGARYSAICNTNGHRVECITTQNIMKFMPVLFKNFRKNTQQIPKRFIYFRDGVSEGEYSKILEDEVYDLRRACRALDPAFDPKFTVIICTKRHHSRFFPNPKDQNSSDRNGNCVPGTIIEKDVTSVTDFDFFLCSHSAIQGTARATKYTVIHDENKIEPDRLQALIYNFCYTYMRATNSVSLGQYFRSPSLAMSSLLIRPLVPPVYYAHLASARARAHEVGGAEKDRQREREEAGMLDTTPSGTRPLVPQSENIRDIHLQIQDSMWYI